MEGLVVKLVETEQELRKALRIRTQVFVREQGIPVEEELDEHDVLPHSPALGSGGPGLLPGQDDERGRQVSHVIALLNGRAIGTGRLVRLGSGEARIGRMAVEKEWRRRGVGARILMALEEVARQQGLTQAVLHAQSFVKHFYSCHGYVQGGEPFLRWTSSTSR